MIPKLSQLNLFLFLRTSILSFILQIWQHFKYIFKKWLQRRFKVFQITTASLYLFVGSIKHTNFFSEQTHWSFKKMVIRVIRVCQNILHILKNKSTMQ